MQIKPIIAAAGLIALTLLGYPPVAAEAAQQSRAANIEQDPEARLGDQHAMKGGRPGTNVAVQNSRPRTDRHKDARKCLNVGNNAAIASCANKYR